MNKIIIFAGTTEGRILAKYCNDNLIPAIVCVATEYGSELLDDLKNIQINKGRKNEKEMEELFLSNDISIIYDATHPYAKIVSENIVNVAKKLNLSYVRVVRKKIEFDDKICLEFEDIDELVKYLKNNNENVLITTGAKEIYKYKDLNLNTLFPRILPNIESIRACEDINIPKSNIIAMQGPFQIDMNIALLKQYKCKYLITKESGSIGGFEEKIQACRALGIKALVIKRPCIEEGISVDKCIEKISFEHMKPKFMSGDVKLKKKLNIKIVGMGMGFDKLLTLEAIEAIREADIFVGANRLLDMCKNIAKENKKTFISYNSKDILNWIYNNAEENEKILLAVSGDASFYSIYKNFKKELNKFIDDGYFDKNINLKVLSGISSLSYICAKFNIDYDNIKIVSLHGRNEKLGELIEDIKYNEKTFVLSSGNLQVNDILKNIISLGLDDIDVYIAQNMSLANEKYLKGKPIEFINEEFEKLSSLIFINKNFQVKKINFGLNDDDFIRDNIPMTKSNIRAICMTKLELAENSICYDIGAGSGSCSIEMATFAGYGKVYAIEQKEDACRLISKNIKKFALNNIELVQGEASEIIDDLEKPTHAFIGGSSGKLDLIVDKIYKKNKDAIIVITAISLETIGDINEIVKKYEKIGYEYDLVFASLADNKRLGKYNMLLANNPILIAKIKRKI